MNIEQELAALRCMTVNDLRTKYAEVFGEATQTRNRLWLLRRIAWRIQMLAEGDLSERARRRAEELARDADLRVIPPWRAAASGASVSGTVTIARDRRLPPPGTVLTRDYRGQTVRVLVLEHGFEHEGRVFKTLSAVAKGITGSHLNGYAFFQLRGNR